MKKTLITLLALGGLAAGGTVATITGNSTTSATQSLTLTSTISADCLQDIISSTVNETLLGFNVFSANSKAAIAVGSYSGSQSLRYFTGKQGGEDILGTGTQFTWTDGTGAAVADADLNDYFSTTGIYAGAITMGYNTPHTYGVTNETKGIYVVFSVSYENGDVKSLIGHTTNVANENKYHINEVSYNSDFLSAPEIVAKTDAAQIDATVTKDSLLAANLKALPTVPEPATATLSLLALAGLAARRRRK